VFHTMVYALSKLFSLARKVNVHHPDLQQTIVVSFWISYNFLWCLLHLSCWLSRPVEFYDGFPYDILYINILNICYVCKSVFIFTIRLQTLNLEVCFQFYRSETNIVTELTFKRRTFKMVVAWACRGLFKCPLLLCV
jgi:hypothetical protein